MTTAPPTQCASCEPDTDRFEDAAPKFLASWTLEQALRLTTQVQGHWHPTGFMVFRSTATFGGLPVRVHCWPHGQRKVEVGTPMLHTHVWPLVAKVLWGTYSEVVYKLTETSNGRLTRYGVQYRTHDDSIVFPDGTRLNIIGGKARSYATGDMHHLAAGVWHETTIPEDEQVVTAMVTGKASFHSPILAGPSGYAAGRRMREKVKPQEIERAFGDLM